MAVLHAVAGSGAAHRFCVQPPPLRRLRTAAADAIWAEAPHCADDRLSHSLLCTARFHRSVTDRSLTIRCALIISIG